MRLEKSEKMSLTCVTCLSMHASNWKKQQNDYFLYESFDFFNFFSLGQESKTSTNFYSYVLMLNQLSQTPLFVSHDETSKSISSFLFFLHLQLHEASRVLNKEEAVWRMKINVPGLESIILYQMGAHYTYIIGRRGPPCMSQMTFMLRLLHILRRIEWSHFVAVARTQNPSFRN